MGEIGYEVVEIINYKLIEELIDKFKGNGSQVSNLGSEKYMSYHYKYNNDFYLNKTANVIGSSKDINYLQLRSKKILLEVPYVQSDGHKFIFIIQSFYKSNHLDIINRYNEDDLDVSVIYLLSEKSMFDETKSINLIDYLYSPLVKWRINEYIEQILVEKIQSKFNVKLFSKIFLSTSFDYSSFNDIVKLYSKIRTQEIKKYELNEFGLLQFDKQKFYDEIHTIYYEPYESYFIDESFKWYEVISKIVLKKNDGASKYDLENDINDNKKYLGEWFLKDIIYTSKVIDGCVYLKVTTEMLIKQLNSISTLKEINEKSGNKSYNDTYLNPSSTYDGNLIKQQTRWNKDHYKEKDINDEKVKYTKTNEETKSKLDLDKYRILQNKKLENYNNVFVSDIYIVEESVSFNCDNIKDKNDNNSFSKYNNLENNKLENYNEYINKKNVENRKVNTYVYVFLCVFLGIYGIHRMYDGKITSGIIMMMITIMSIYLLSFITFFWALFDLMIFLVSRKKIL